MSSDSSESLNAAPAYATNNLTYPYNCVVLLNVWDAAGGWRSGSGVIVGPHTILTASHMIWDSPYNAADSQIYIYPGYSSNTYSGFPEGTGSPIYGHWNAHYYPVSYTSTSFGKDQSAIDYAVIDTAYTFSGWFGMTANFAGGTVNVTGYPVSMSGIQDNRTGTVTRDSNYAVFDYGTIYCEHGNSGGPLWVQKPDGPHVVGVVSSTGAAVALTNNDFWQIQDWVNGDGYSLTGQVIHSNNIALCGDVTGSYNSIDLLNLEASHRDLILAFGANAGAMQNWFNARESIEKRPDTFDGLDYIASYGDLINAFKNAGGQRAVLDAGATHFIQSGLYEGRTTSFNGLDYIASYPDLINAFGVNGDAGAYHFIENGHNEGRATIFDGLDYIASYVDLIRAFGANEQAGAAHYIQNGSHEGRATTFDGLDYIAGYADLMWTYGANNDAGAKHFIQNGLSEGRYAHPFNVAAYESAHADLIGRYSSDGAFLTAYINTYLGTGKFLT